VTIPTNLKYLSLFSTIKLLNIYCLLVLLNYKGRQIFGMEKYLILYKLILLTSEAELLMQGFSSQI
jgi:hypothetical protein